MAKEKNGSERAHKATYARDRDSGGWNIRITGPHANKFRGRVVPVTRVDGSEDTETLGKVLWTGTDELTKQPVALYSFEPKPKDEKVHEVDF